MEILNFDVLTFDVKNTLAKFLLNYKKALEFKKGNEEKESEI